MTQDYEGNGDLAEAFERVDLSVGVLRQLV